MKEVRVVHRTASLETCPERNRAREEPIDEQGAHVVYREFDPVDAGLTVDTDELTIDGAVDRLVRTIGEWD